MTASVKIRTSWTDGNVIIEGVRIYKKQQAFDASTRPQTFVEITDSSLFYEDFDVVENQTYFYMLSCFLGEQEVFTECYQVNASAVVEVVIPKITALNSSASLNLGTNSGNICSWFTPNGLDFFTTKKSAASDVNLFFNKAACVNAFSTTGASFSDIETGLMGRAIASICFFNGGLNAVIGYFSGASSLTHRYAVVQCQSKYDVSGAVILSNNTLPINSVAQLLVSNDAVFFYHVTQAGVATRYTISGEFLATHSLSLDAEVNLSGIFENRYIQSLSISNRGTEIVICVGAQSQQKSIITAKLTTAFDLSTIANIYRVDRGVSTTLTRLNRSGNLLYDLEQKPFMLLHKTEDPEQTLKEFVSISDWI